MVNISHMIHIPVSDCHVSLLHPNCLQLHCDKALRCYIDLQNWLRRTNEGNMGRTVAIDDIFVRWWFANKLLTNTSKSTTDTEQPSRKYNNAAMPVKISTLLGGAWKKPWCGKKTVKHQLQELHQTPKLQMNGFYFHGTTSSLQRLFCWCSLSHFGADRLTTERSIVLSQQWKYSALLRQLIKSLKAQRRWYHLSICQ